MKNKNDLSPYPALNLAPFSRWTLRDKAAQRRLPLQLFEGLKVRLGSIPAIQNDERTSE